MKRRFTVINKYRTAVNFYGGIFIFTLYPHPSIDKLYKNELGFLVTYS